MEARMHDLSDGFVIPGPWSQPNVPSDVSTTAAQLRSNDGNTFIELDPDAHTVTITAPQGATINADVTINGDLHVTGTITGDEDVVTGSISLKDHVHGGVQGGDDETGAPES
jgi:phage baseplate assembly protein gpV